MSGFVEAEARVRQLHAAYADAVWRKDLTSFGDCYTPEAEWRISGMVLRGRGEIEAGFAAVLATCNRILMTFRTPQVELTGDGHASARVYVTEQCTWTDKAPTMNIGRYYDRCVVDGDRWRFSWRLFQLLYTGPADLTGEYQEHPDYGVWPGMPPLDAVPPPAPSRP